MTDAVVADISNRYIELYENITGEKFIKDADANPVERIERNVSTFLKAIKN
jgi:phosphoribosylaminoimidazole-succinocarboxamide synthase